MESTSCARCGAKIQPAVAHACGGNDYVFPAALEILAELKRIRELLEQPPTARTRKTEK